MAGISVHCLCALPPKLLQDSAQGDASETGEAESRYAHMFSAPHSRSPSEAGCDHGCNSTKRCSRLFQPLVLSKHQALSRRDILLARLLLPVLSQNSWRTAVIEHSTQILRTASQPHARLTWHTSRHNIFFLFPPRFHPHNDFSLMQSQPIRNFRSVRQTSCEQLSRT